MSEPFPCPIMTSSSSPVGLCKSHQLHPWHRPCVNPFILQMRTTSLPEPTPRSQRYVQPCAEPVTCVCRELHIPTPPPPWWGPHWSLHTETCQFRRKPSVKLFKPPSCLGVRGAHRGTWDHRAGSRPLNSCPDWGICGRMGHSGVSGGWLIAGQMGRLLPLLPI